MVTAQGKKGTLENQRVVFLGPFHHLHILKSQDALKGQAGTGESQGI